MDSRDRNVGVRRPLKQDADESLETDCVCPTDPRCLGEVAGG